MGCHLWGRTELGSAPMNNGIHVSLSGCLGVGLLGHMVVLFLVFKESPYHLPLWLYQFTFPPTVQELSLFSTPSSTFIVCRLFDEGHSDQCEVISHCSFYLNFSNNGECSHEIKRRLFLGRKVMTNLDSILKSGDITLPTNIRLVKAMVFPVVMYGRES